MKAFGQSILLGTGTIVNSLLGLVFYALVARSLSVADFGHFSFLIALGVLAADLLDLGINSAIIKFAHGEKFYPVFTLAIIQRMIVGVILFSVAIIAAQIWGGDFIWAAAVAWFSLLLYVVTQSLLAMQKYLLNILVNITGNTLRILLILWGFAAVGTFVVANAFAFMMGIMILILLHKHCLLSFKEVKANTREVLGFSGWSGLSFSLSALSNRLDVQILYLLSGGAAVGIYSSAQRLSSVFPQIVSTIDGVFSPKFSVKEDFKKHFREFIILSGLLSLGILIFIPFSRWLIPLVFGAKYEASIIVFQVLLIGMAIFSFTAPFSSSVLYRFAKPKIHFFTAIVQLAFSLVFYFTLVPRLGAMGAALTFVIVSAVSLSIFMFYHILFSRENV